MTTCDPSTINEKAPIEAEFRVQDVLGSAQAIYLESVQTPGQFISFDDDGQPYDDMRLRNKEKVSQLEIQLVSLKVFIGKISYMIDLCLSGQFDSTYLLFK